MILVDETGTGWGWWELWSRRPGRTVPTLDEIELGTRAASIQAAENAAPAALPARLRNQLRPGHLAALPHRWEVDEQTPRRRRTA